MKPISEIQKWRCPANTDFYKMLKIIYDSDYSGVISIEFEGHDLDPIEGSLKTKKLIHKALQAAAE